MESAWFSAKQRNKRYGSAARTEPCFIPMCEFMWHKNLYGRDSFAAILEDIVEYAFRMRNYMLAYENHVLKNV